MKRDLLTFGASTNDIMEGTMRRALFISCGLALGACAAPAQAQTNIAPQAERVLSAACQYLAEAPFSVSTPNLAGARQRHGPETPVLPDGCMEVKRPNKSAHGDCLTAFATRFLV